MAATAILKFAFLVISHRPIVRFRRNFVWETEWRADKGHMIKTASFQNLTWSTAAILKIVKLKMLDFDKIWCTTSYIEFDEVFKSAIAESQM